MHISSWPFHPCSHTKKLWAFSPLFSCTELLAISPLFSCTEAHSHLTTVLIHRSSRPSHHYSHAQGLFHLTTVPIHRSSGRSHHCSHAQKLLAFSSHVLTQKSSGPSHPCFHVQRSWPYHHCSHTQKLSAISPLFSYTEALGHLTTVLHTKKLWAFSPPFPCTEALGDHTTVLTHRSSGQSQCVAYPIPACRTAYRKLSSPLLASTLSDWNDSLVAVETAAILELFQCWLSPHSLNHFHVFHTPHPPPTLAQE